MTFKIWLNLLYGISYCSKNDLFKFICGSVRRTKVIPVLETLSVYIKMLQTSKMCFFSCKGIILEWRQPWQQDSRGKEEMRGGESREGHLTEVAMVK